MKRELRSSQRFERHLAKFVHNNSRLQESVRQALQLLSENMTHPELKYIHSKVNCKERGRVHVDMIVE